jgi:hypothetical protein
LCCDLGVRLGSVGCRSVLSASTSFLSPGMLVSVNCVEFVQLFAFAVEGSIATLLVVFRRLGRDYSGDVQLGKAVILILH